MTMVTGSREKCAKNNLLIKDIFQTPIWEIDSSFYILLFYVLKASCSCISGEKVNAD